MADIELVVKIPEEEYEDIINSEDCGLHRLTRAISNGTPLPKGHGRLIDADALEYEPYLVSKGNGMYEEIKGYFNIDDAPTIIEAESEE